MHCPRMLAVIALALAALAIVSPVEFSKAAVFQTAATANADARTAAPDNTIRLHGVVEPIRSQLVTAPRITGSGAVPGTPPPQLVIVRLAKAGTMVRKGDLLVEFDRTSQLKNARDREAEYRDILAQIDKKQAEQIIARAARQTGLKIAGNAVRAAELDLVGVELLAKITAEKNQQVLEEARAK